MAQATRFARAGTGKDAGLLLLFAPKSNFYLSFAKSLRQHQKDFFPLDVSTSILLL